MVLKQVDITGPRVRLYKVVISLFFMSPPLLEQMKVNSVYKMYNTVKLHKRFYEPFWWKTKNFLLTEVVIHCSCSIQISLIQRVPGRKNWKTRNYLVTEWVLNCPHSVQLSVFHIQSHSQLSICSWNSVVRCDFIKSRVVIQTVSEVSLWINNVFFFFKSQKN